MKKILLASLILIIALVGCGKKEEVVEKVVIEDTATDFAEKSEVSSEPIDVTTDTDSISAVQEEVKLENIPVDVIEDDTLYEIQPSFINGIINGEEVVILAPKDGKEITEETNINGLKVTETFVEGSIKVIDNYENIEALLELQDDYYVKVSYRKPAYNEVETYAWFMVSYLFDNYSDIVEKYNYEFTEECEQEILDSITDEDTRIVVEQTFKNIDNLYQLVSVKCYDKETMEENAFSKNLVVEAETKKDNEFQDLLDGAELIKEDTVEVKALIENRTYKNKSDLTIYNNTDSKYKIHIIGILAFNSQYIDKEEVIDIGGEHGLSGEYVFTVSKITDDDYFQNFVDDDYVIKLSEAEYIEEDDNYLLDIFAKDYIYNDLGKPIMIVTTNCLFSDDNDKEYVIQPEEYYEVDWQLVGAYIYSLR